MPSRLTNCCCCVVLACCTGEKNKAISAAVCGALQQHLGVPPNRVYIRVRRAGVWGEGEGDGREGQRQGNALDGAGTRGKEWG